jgi:hypothetical protein
MQKIIIGFVVAGVVIAGTVLGFLVLMKDESKVAEEVKEEMVVEEKEIPVAKNKQGSFIKIDPLHYATGNASVEQVGGNYKIKFAENFAAANGPDLYVYLSSPQSFRNIAIGGLNTAKTLNLGALKKISGPQEYLVSKKDFENHSASILIWCKQFSVQFSRADLQ